MFSNYDTDQIIEKCLQAIRDGSMTPEACAARYPEIADLAVMLHAALEMYKLWQIRLEPNKSRIIEKRLVQAMSKRQVRPALVSPWSGIRSALAASFLIFLLIGLGIGKAATSALPGDIMYNVKRTAEQVSLWTNSTFGNNQSEAGALVDIATARLTELTSLASKNQPVTAAFFTDVLKSTDRAANAKPSSARLSALYVQIAKSVQALVTNKNDPAQIGALSAQFNALTPSVLADPAAKSQ